MKAIIFMGGLDTRIYEETINKPKPININFYQLDLIKNSLLL